MRTRSLALVGALLLASVGAATAIVDDPPSEEELAHQRIHDHKQQDAPLAGGVPPNPIEADECVDGTAAGLFACDGVDLLSFTPTRTFDTASPTVSDLWGWTDPDTGDEYVILGKTTGVGFFRITDPTNPVYLGELENHAALDLRWYDIKTYRNHAYIVSESAPHGMQVFDLTQLRDAEEPREWSDTAFFPLNVSAHNIAINTDAGYAYIVGGNTGIVVPGQCNSGLLIVDISTPDTPVFAGCHAVGEGPGTAARVVGSPATDVSPVSYIHDAHCVTYDGPDEDHVGSDICVNSSELHVSVVDVSIPQAPLQLSTVEYPDVTYSHQGWLTEDHRYFLLNDELDEQDHGLPTRTLIFDVSDLDDPELVGEHLHGTTSIDHNLYIRDGLVYQSNYTAGLRVLDTDDVADGALEEVAYFDTYPADDAVEFNGTWSNYPYFDSGTIPVSGKGEGLFLLRVQDDVLAEHADTPADDGPGGGG